MAIITKIVKPNNFFKQSYRLKNTRSLLTKYAYHPKQQSRRIQFLLNRNQEPFHSLYKSTRYIHIPNFNKPPNKYELLIQARGFIQRLKVRIKYPLMKQMRPFNVNDISALISWVFLGNTAWLVLGTTSFISFVLWSANSLQFQEWIANKVGRYLTVSIDAFVKFESATPNWKAGKIRLNNVEIVCMPQSELKRFLSGTAEKNPTVVQGDLLFGIELSEDEKTPKALKILKKMPWFSLKIDTIEVEVSLMRLMEGKGIIKKADVKGVRGIIDNRRSGWNQKAIYDPEAIRKGRMNGGFEIEKLLIEDLSVTVYMPQGFRPFPLSIIQAQLSRLRKKLLFYDLLCANSIIGSIDNSIFSVHTPQLEKSIFEHSDLERKTGAAQITEYYPFKKNNPRGVLVGGEDEKFGLITDDGMKAQGYQRKSRLRIESISMDHIHRFGEGPPQWLTSGTMDFCADLYIPDESHKDVRPTITEAVIEVIKRSSPSSITVGTGLGHQIELGGEIKTLSDSQKEEQKVIIDIDVRLKDIKGTVPLKIPDLSYLNSAMVRPLIAYINHNKTIVPIKGRIVMDYTAFKGAWTIQDSTLSRKLNECVIKGIVGLAKDQQERNKRLKQVGFWSFREIIRSLVALQETARGTARGFWTNLGQ